MVLGQGIIPHYRVDFRHSHGGTGWGSAHKPFSNSDTLFCARLAQDD